MSIGVMPPECKRPYGIWLQQIL